MDLTISIVNYNTRELLKECLHSIFRTAEGINFEVFVVDNNSRDGSAEMVKEKFLKVRVIQNKFNIGFASANNQVIHKAKGRYILLLNSDTQLLPGALKQMIEFMDCHPEIGACGPKLLNSDLTLQPSCRSFPTLLTVFFDYTGLATLFPRSKIIGKYLMSYWDFDETREVDYAIGACLMVRREAMQEIGFMDEQFFMYGEDVDLCYRLKKAGWKTFFYPEARVIHHFNQSGKIQSRKVMITAFYESNFKFFAKHYGGLGIFGLKILVGFRIFWWKLLPWSLRYLFDGGDETKDILSGYLNVFKMLSRTFKKQH